MNERTAGSVFSYEIRSKAAKKGIKVGDKVKVARLTYTEMYLQDKYCSPISSFTSQELMDLVEIVEDVDQDGVILRGVSCPIHILDLNVVKRS